MITAVADDDEERNLRRVSYLRATKEDRMHIGKRKSQIKISPPDGTSVE